MSSHSLIALAVSLHLVLAVACAAELYKPMEPPFVDIIAGGRANCVIVTPPEPSEAVAYAAQELQTYLDRISGAQVPIAAGRGAGFPLRLVLDPALGPETLRIACDGSALTLAGGDDRGVCYAVYAFLEECLGVRWFTAREEGEVVPRMATVRVGRIDRTESPDFPLRWVGRGEWALRNRCNVGTPVAAIKMLWPGHSWSQIIPAEIYFDEHPEFFSYKADTKQRTRRQLCTSNPALIAEVVRRIREGLDADPEIRIVGICPNDGMGFCECDACQELDEPGRPGVREVNSRYLQLGIERRGALTRRIILFANAVAKQIAESHPGVLIRCFVYNAYLEPPADKSIRCEPNLLVHVCHNTCHGHPFAEDPCELNEPFRRWVDEWAGLGGRIAIYEYYKKGGAMRLPWPMAHNAAVDIPYLHDVGAHGLYTQYTPNEIGITALNFHLMARLAWDASADVDAVLADYFEKMYGPAADPMSEVYALLEQRASGSELHPKGVSDTKYQFVEDWFAGEVITRCNAWLAEARAATTDDAIVRRIHLHEAVLGFADLMRRYREAVRLIPGKDGPDRDSPQFAEAQKRAEAVHTHIESERGILLADKYIEAYLNPVQAWRRIRADIANPW